MVVMRLKAQRYLNDTNYAESYSRFRKENEKFGRLRVVQDLKIKGVHDDIIDSVVGAAYDNVNEEQLAREFLRRKRIVEAGRTEAGSARFSHDDARRLYQPYHFPHTEDLGCR